MFTPVDINTVLPVLNNATTINEAVTDDDTYNESINNASGDIDLFFFSPLPLAHFALENPGLIQTFQITNIDYHIRLMTNRKNIDLDLFIIDDVSAVLTQTISNNNANVWQEHNISFSSLALPVDIFNTTTGAGFGYETQSNNNDYYISQLWLDITIDYSGPIKKNNSSF